MRGEVSIPVYDKEGNCIMQEPPLKERLRAAEILGRYYSFLMEMAQQRTSSRSSVEVVG
jgi:hypothetical protein